MLNKICRITPIAALLVLPHTIALAQTRSQQIRAELASVLLQSRRYDEAAHEYAVLLASSPRNYSYRLNRARALLWGRRSREAEREITVLIADRGRDPQLESMLLSARTQLEPSSSEAAAWMRERPALEYRHIYARALAREGRHSSALAQYDTLITSRQSAALYVERAHVHVGRNDLTAAERDVASSIQLGPSADAYMLAGDIHRAHGNHAAARTAFWSARRHSSEVDLAAAIGRVERDERPVVGLLPDVYGDARGWRARTATTADNLGAQLTTTTLRRGTWFNGFDASVGAKARWFTAPSVAPFSNAGAYGLDVGLAREAGRGHWFGRGRARVGVLQQVGGEASPEGEVAAVLYYRAWGAGFELGAGPAYPEMLTLETFRPSVIGTQPLREQSSTLSFAGPIGRLDVGTSYRGTSLSDGNTRTIVQALARLPVNAHVALMYSGTSMSFAQQSALYWSPELYNAHGIGPELTLRKLRGWSAQVRLLPGIASATERDSTGATVRSTAMQLTTSGALTYRRGGWEVGAGAAFGRGRAGDYERFDANVFLSFAP